MAILPADIPTGLVTGTYTLVKNDSSDLGTEPELVYPVGNVTFTCSARELLVGTPATTVIPRVFVADFDAKGQLVPRGGTGIGISLPATDTDFYSPMDFTWTADFSIRDTDTGFDCSIKPFAFQVPAGATIDLTLATPVDASGGVLTIRGPAGPKGNPGPKGDTGDGGVPVGGTARQFLRKNLSNTTAEWVSPDSLSVADYGAKGDGVADDTAAVNASLIAASGKTLCWPAGTYKVTANLVNFWQATHTGPGVLKRGTETFTIEPNDTPALIQTNTLWVNSTGTDSNDGLFSVSPVKTMQAMYGQTLRRISPKQSSNGNWVVRMSGTLPRGQKFSALPAFKNGLTFQGDALVSGNPVTTVSYDGNSSYAIGMWFEPGSQITVNNIKFSGFQVGFNGYGVLMKRGGFITLNNCWADLCDIGFAAIQNTSFTFLNTKATNCSDGFRAQYSASGTFDTCTANNCTNTGFFISRNAVVHIDYCLANDNPIGILVDMAARANVMGGNYKRNAIGVRTEGSGEWVDTLSPANTWNIGTADANGIKFSNYGVGRETRQYSQGTRNEFCIGNAWEANSAYLNPVTVTGSTTNTVAYLGSGLGIVPAGWFVNPGKTLRVKAYGQALTTSPARVRLYVTELDGSAVTLLDEQLIGAGGTNTNFEVEIAAWSKTPTSQVTKTNLLASGLSAAGASTAAINMNTAKYLRLYVLLGATGDKIVLDNMEVFTKG